MKRFLSLLLAALMALAGLSALAAPAYYDAEGFALDYDAIAAKSENTPALVDYGVLDHDPYISEILVAYYALPRDAVTDLQRRMESAENEEAYQRFYDVLSRFFGWIGAIIVTDAKTLSEIGIEEPIPEDCALIEFGTAGDYHFYWLTEPVDELLAAFDTDEDMSEYGGTPQELKERAIADIERVRSELLDQLRAAELSEPSDPDAEYIGRTIEFESVDLDGNPIRSADLFKDNRITMVNVWGTWCVNCIDEMAELAELHKRLQEKGCGIVGVEWERQPLEEVADLARRTLADNGVTYPSAIMPEDDPIFSEVHSFPTTFFVDSEGRILTWPIKGADVEQYEPTVDRLLAGEAADPAPEAAATANGADAYRVIVCDADGNPVKGAVVQLCDDATCSIQKTDADGVATFRVETPKAYEVHVAKVPEGYAPGEETYVTPDTFSDLNIVIDRAE